MNTEAINTEAEIAVVKPGDLLKKERIKQNLAIEDIAKKLYLTKQNIEYLENNEFNKLPGDVFVRGYLRSYARLLGLYSNDLIDLYIKFTKPQEQKISKLKQNNIASINANKKSGLSYVIVMLIGIAIIFGCTWVINNSNKTAQVINNEAVSAINNANIVVPDNIDRLAENNLDQDENSFASNQTEKETEQVTEEQVVEPAIKILKINFGNECWIKVVDADNKTLIDAIYKKGQSVETSGKEPFKVNLGNGRNVQISYDGEPVKFKIRSSGSASFTVTSLDNSDANAD